MSRSLPSWAQPRHEKRRPKLTWPADALAALVATVRPAVPAGAPRRPALALPALNLRSTPSGRHLLFRALSLRLDVELVAADSLAGLQPPVVFAANEQGALDYQVLQWSLPPRLRPTMIAPSRALARGRNVVVFADEPMGHRLVGEFSTIPADLSNQHGVPIVPVGVVGTFKLGDILKLALRTRPKVSVRFGAPIYSRGRSLAESTAELQGRVEDLVNEGDLSWWTVQRRRGVPAEAGTLNAAPRWRRLWEQAGPAKAAPARIWR